MNNHLSPKAPKPLLWPQPTFFWPQPTFFGLPAASSVAAPFLCSPSLFFCAHILSLPRPSQRLVEPVAPEKPPPVRQTARSAPETLIQPPPVRQTALFAHEGLHRAAPVRQTARFAPETLIRPPPVRQTALFAHEGLHRAAPVRQTARFAPETPIRPPPVRQTARFAPQICSRDPPPSIPEPVDESILSTYKFVIKPDVIRIAVLLTEVGEGIFTARSRVARFAVSLNE